MALPTPGPPHSFADAHAILTAPGALFETEQVVVDGRVLPSFKELSPSLRSFWLTTVRTFGNKPYVVYEQQRYTYAELHERASRLASVFHQQYHVRKGDRVAIAMRNCSEWLISFWACHLLGAISTQVNAWLPGKPFLHCLTVSGAKVVIVDPERAARLAPHMSALRSDAVVLLASASGGVPGVVRGNLRRHPSMRHFDSVIDGYEGKPEAWRKERECLLDEPATLFFTSGTTGLPKGVLSSHRSFMHAYMVNAYSRDLCMLRMGYPPVGRPDPSIDRATMLGVPLFHVTGTTSTMMGCTWSGFKFVLLRKWDKEKAAEIARAEGVNAFIGVPSMAFDLTESSLAGYTNLLQLSYGGAPAAKTIPALGQKAFPNVTMGQGYGLTETNGPVISVLGKDYMERPGSTGLCPPANEMLIVSESGKVLPTGEVGELWIRGANVMMGYWKNKEETDKSITKDGWFKTGDLAYLDKERFVYIVDRVKDMIIRGGENIHSVNVENAIYADSRVHDVAVVGIPDQRLGELVGALVVPKPEFFGKVTSEEILQQCKASLPHFAVPVLVVLQKDAIVRNAAGKIVKTEVRKMLADAWKRQNRTASKAKAKL